MPLRALLIGVPASGLNVSLALERLEPALASRGFDPITTLTGNAATRTGILAALDRLLADTAPDDGVLLYYFGHGGRVRFTDLAPPLDGHTYGYVTCTQQGRGAPWEAVLDQELSRHLTALDERCGNMTAIFDCCFSGEMVRDTATPADYERVEKATDWARTVTEQPGQLAIDSHPRIVRITGASSKREAFAATRGGRSIGRLTEALLATLDDAGEQWAQWTWDTVGLRVREHVIAALGMEGQWVNVAGPRHRRLFSRDTHPRPGTVAFVPSDDDDTRGWLRAGWQQGVREGDRWALLGPTDDAPIATATIDAVDSNLAAVAVDRLGGPLPAGSPAIVLRLARPIPIEVPNGVDLDASPWLTIATPPTERVTLDEHGLTLHGQPPVHTANDAAGRAVIRALLEDRARLHTLDAILAEHEPDPCPIAWTWRRIDGDELPRAGATLSTDNRVAIDLHHAGRGPIRWFCSVVYVDPSGGLHLLSARMPEGIELRAGERETIGVRPGRATQGLTLPCPDDLMGSGELRFFASRRPMSLAHVVSAQASDDDAAFALQGLLGDTRRGSEPELSRACAWDRITFTVIPPN